VGRQIERLAGQRIVEIDAVAVTAEEKDAEEDMAY
jgi:hypothetical protein